MQIRIWELAIEYEMDPEELRRTFSGAGLHRSSTESLVPDVDARKILAGGRKRRTQAPGQDQKLSEAAAIFGVDKRSLKPRREASQPGFEQTDWDREFFPPEAMEWRDNGIHDVRVAVKARDAGLSPSDMKVKSDGVPVGQWLANGESVASVKSRLRERKAESG